MGIDTKPTPDPLTGEEKEGVSTIATPIPANSRITMFLNMATTTLVEEEDDQSLVEPWDLGGANHVFEMS